MSIFPFAFENAWQKSIPTDLPESIRRTAPPGMTLSACFCVRHINAPRCSSAASRRPTSLHPLLLYCLPLTVPFNVCCRNIPLSCLLFISYFQLFLPFLSSLSLPYTAFVDDVASLFPSPPGLPCAPRLGALCDQASLDRRCAHVFSGSFRNASASLRSSLRNRSQRTLSPRTSAKLSEMIRTSKPQLGIARTSLSANVSEKCYHRRSAMSQMRFTFSQTQDEK